MPGCANVADKFWVWTKSVLMDAVPLVLSFLSGILAGYLLSRRSPEQQVARAEPGPTKADPNYGDTGGKDLQSSQSSVDRGLETHVRSFEPKGGACNVDCRSWGKVIM